MKKFFIISLSVFIMSYTLLYSQKQLHVKHTNITKKGNIIFGLITKQDNTYYITQNWRSRSMVTYKIEGDISGLENYINKPVLAAGKVIKAQEPPRNRFELQSIQRCWESGKPVTIKGTVKKGKKNMFIIEHPLPNERFIYIITLDKTKSVENYTEKDITIKGIIKEEKNWQKVLIEIDEIASEK